MLGKKNNIMRQFLAITLLLLSLSITAQNNIQTILTEYSNHNISFENPKIKEYSEKYAQIYHDMCIEILSADEIQSKLDELSKAYSSNFKTMSKNDNANLIKISNLLNTDCNKYTKKRNLIKDIAWTKGQLREQNKGLYKEVEDAKISFDNVSFGEFAIEMEDLTFKKCSTDMSHKEYDLKAKQIRQKYDKTLKTASKKDMETLALLYKIVHIRCTNFNVEKQYSVNR